MADTGFRGPKKILAAARYSLQGLAAAYRYESSFRLEIYVLLVLLPLALWLGDNRLERWLLIACLLPVLVAELLNSAVEAAVDCVHPERHELIGRAKDLGSAAVFVCQLGAGMTWLVVLWPN
jgi:diacylglycerol kinase (ATP)